MKLPPSYRTLLRCVAVILVVTVTLLWAYRNPDKIEQLRGMLGPSFPAAPQTWIVIKHQRFSLCGHQETEQTTFTDQSQLRTALAKKLKNRSLNKKGNGYEYTITSKNFCQSCREKHFLGLHGQEIVVYRGTPLKPGPILEKVMLKTTLLPEAELKDLQSGIPFRDSRDKLQLIEGLNGLITE